jgi:hypothetical protein
LLSWKKIAKKALFLLSHTLIIRYKNIEKNKNFGLPLLISWFVTADGTII